MRYKIRDRNRRGAADREGDPQQWTKNGAGNIVNALAAAFYTCIRCSTEQRYSV